ncbi:MAG: ATP-binding protein [Chitinispirillia bacterium]|nr:ATP-binding protein [Chitinispirillia bacterium]
MSEIHNGSDPVELNRELQKENRVLKRKLLQAETDLKRLQAFVDAQDRVESILNESLKKELRYFNLVLDNATNILFLLDSGDNFAYSSKTFLDEIDTANFGIIGGHHYKEILSARISEKNLSDLCGAIESAKEKKVTVSLEEEIDFNLDGTPRTFSINVTPMIDDEGKITGIMVLFNDITEINNALEAAKQASLAKSKFLATMSHEIRTPMNAIIGISDIELEREDHPLETRDSFDRINNSGKTLLGIINDILDLSKIETGKLELMPVKYETASLINDTVRLNAMRIGSKQIEFVIKVAETLPATLLGDELRIKQILNNMLSNAIKYTQQGRVTFETDSKTGGGATTLIFKIRDTGQGMTKEQIQALYDEYSMFNREANRLTEGTGLGMSITKSLVELMNGKIIVESEPGVGSVFTVHLTQQPAEDKVLGKELAENLQKFEFTSKMQRTQIIRDYMPYGSVLIVDDVEANLFVAKGLMKPYGLKIETAISGFEALDKIRNGKVYDIVFMDHMMPGMDGIEATKLIREAGYTHPVVALTANAISGQKEIFLGNGFDDFISKPIDIRQLNFILNKRIRDKQSPEVLEDARRQNESRIAAASKNGAGNAAEDNSPLALLKRVDGLNVNGALDAMSGLEDVYIDTVKLTVRLLPERLDKMDNYIVSDMKSFTVEVHGLKSVLKNIGAAALGNSAAMLERAALEDNTLYCSEYYPPFKTGLIALKDALNEALRLEASDKKSADKSSLVQIIADAKAAAESFDRDSALEIITPCSEFSYCAQTDELLEKIVFALEAFDCEGALENIIKLEENL